MHTKDRLAAALEAIGLPVMAAQARKGMYDDWESELATPITQLVNNLARIDTPEAHALQAPP